MKLNQLGWGICLSLTLSTAHSNTSASDYFQAQNGIANGDDISLYSSLANHPLYPDLAAEFYHKNLDRDAEITRLFTDFYSYTPIKKLHNRWIEHKYQLSDYTALVQHYYDTRDETAECQYRAAQMALGNTEAALENIYWTWMSSKSVSPFCDSVFYAWDGANKAQNLLTRAKMAYRAGNGDLTARLAMRLSFDDPNRETLAQFAAFLNNPESMLSMPANSLINSELARELLPEALKKLTRKDSSQFAGFATQFAGEFKENEAYQDMLSKLVEYLANRDDPQVQSVYAQLTSPSNKATDSLLHYLVGTRDWGSIRQLVKPNSNDSMALYWLGRALEASGEDATAVYQKAAKTRSYYGFLSADKVGAPYQFNQELIRPTAQQALNQNKSLIRAKYLAQYGEPLEARREIIRLSIIMGKSRQRQLAYWLSRNGFNFEAIYLLGKAKDWNDINIRFPTPYNSAVSNASTLTGADTTWIYAIMRQESSMNPNAVSRSKAKGLMQLIPSTARLMAKQESLSLYGDGIFNPMINTQLGAAYLAKMFYRFNNMAMASAAYNAGPGRVDKWMLRNTDDMAIWVEKIPFKETRKYVKNILEYQQVYANHLGASIPTATEVLEGRYQAVR